LSHTARSFTITDPRTFDGNPFEVAQRSALQSAAIAKLLGGTFEGVRLMVRNAELERQLQSGEQPDPKQWEDGPQGTALTKMADDVSSLTKKLEAVARAAGFDPKHPPKEL
jgi:hypothetical protein